MLVLADGVVLVHLAFVIFVVAGGFVVLRWKRVAWVHAPVALWGAGISLGRWICPLTPLENWLRARSGGAPYAGGFIDHYVMPVLYPVALTRELQIAAGVFVLALNALLYWRVFGATRSSGRRRPPPA